MKHVKNIIKKQHGTFLFFIYAEKKNRVYVAKKKNGFNILNKNETFFLIPWKQFYRDKYVNCCRCFKFRISSFLLKFEILTDVIMKTKWADFETSLFSLKLSVNCAWFSFRMRFQLLFRWLFSTVNLKCNSLYLSSMWCNFLQWLQYLIVLIIITIMFELNLQLSRFTYYYWRLD